MTSSQGIEVIMRKIAILNCILTIVFMALANNALAANTLEIKPIGYQYHDRAAANGTTLSIPYEIVNLSRLPVRHVFATFLPLGATATRCKTLAGNGGRCTLTITLPAKSTKLVSNIRSKFFVCGLNPILRCTQTNSSNQINIELIKAHSFLAIADIHLKAGHTDPITYGDDTGEVLWKSTLDNLTRVMTEQSPTFMVLLGDLPAHHDRPNLEKNITSALKGFSNLDAIYNRQLPTFFVMGNNDSLTVNYGPFSNGANQPVNLFSFDPEHNWPALNTNPDCNTSPNAACTYPKDMTYAQSNGYYSAYPLGSQTPLRFIAVNSVIFSCEYYVLGESQLVAAQAQFDWLTEQLADARAKGEAVYIGMHMPVGDDAFNHSQDMWNDKITLRNGMTLRNAFLALADEYKDTIRLIMSGHTHFNEIRALYADSAQTRLSVLDVGLPAITPNHNSNPAMQVYLYNSDYQTVEQKTYYTTPQPGTWMSHSFQNDYQCARASTLLSCTFAKLLTNTSAIDQYKSNYSVHAANYDPTKYASWQAILNEMKVTPVEIGQK
jgi:hypothetical protein